MTMPPFHRILAPTVICLAAVGLNSCLQTKEDKYWEDMEPLEDDEMPILDYFPPPLMGKNEPRNSVHRLQPVTA